MPKNRKIKITSYVNSGFKVDGVLIVPGTKRYPLDYKKKHIAFQLGILKDEGHINFDEIIKVEKGALPFEPPKKEDKKVVEQVTTNDDADKPEEQVTTNDDADKPNKKNKSPRKR